MAEPGSPDSAEQRPRVTPAPLKKGASRDAIPLEVPDAKQTSQRRPESYKNPYPSKEQSASPGEVEEAPYKPREGETTEEALGRLAKGDGQEEKPQPRDNSGGTPREKRSLPRRRQVRPAPMPQSRSDDELSGGTDKLAPVPFAPIPLPPERDAQEEPSGDQSVPKEPDVAIPQASVPDVPRPASPSGPIPPLPEKSDPNQQQRYDGVPDESKKPETVVPLNPGSDIPIWPIRRPTPPLSDQPRSDEIPDEPDAVVPPVVAAPRPVPTDPPEASSGQRRRGWGRRGETPPQDDGKEKDDSPKEGRRWFGKRKPDDKTPRPDKPQPAPRQPEGTTPPPQPPESSGDRGGTPEDQTPPQPETTTGGPRTRPQEGRRGGREDAPRGGDVPPEAEDTGARPEAQTPPPEQARPDDSEPEAAPRPRPTPERRGQDGEDEPIIPAPIAPEREEARPEPTPTEEGEEGQQPPPQPTGNETPPPQENEDVHHTITVVNRSADLEKRARELVDEQIKAAYLRGGKWNPLHMARRAGLKMAEEHIRRRGIKRAKKAMLENNNVFLQTNVIGRGARHLESTFQDYRAQEREAAKAKIEQIQLEDEARLGGDVQLIRRATNPMGEALTREVLRPMLELPDDADQATREARVQELLRTFVRTHRNDRNTAISSQVDGFFGKDATDFNQMAEYFGTDMLDVVDAIKTDRAAHEWALDEIDQRVTFSLANTNWAADTGRQLSRAERTVAGSQRFGINEATASAGISIAAQVLKRGGVRALGLGVGSGFALGFLDRWKNLKRDRQSYQVGIEYGERKGNVQRGLKNRLDARAQLERRSYETASVTDMLNSDEDRGVVGGDARSLNTLLGLDLSVPGNREALVLRVAEIKERLRFGAAEQAAVTQLESKVTADQSRLLLVKGIVEGRRALIASGMSAEEADEAIRGRMSDWEKRFTKDKKTQDRKFRNYRVRSSLMFGTLGGASALAIGLGSQQVAKEAGELILDRPANPTIAENIVEKIPEMPGQVADFAKELPGDVVEAVKHIPEIPGKIVENPSVLNPLNWAPFAEEHKPDETIASRLRDTIDQLKMRPGEQGEFEGVKFHVEQNGNIVLDGFRDLNINVTVPPELQFNAKDQNFIFHGDLPPQIEDRLEHAGFRIRELLSSTAMQAEVVRTTIPGTNLKVDLPQGTYLREVGNSGKYELWTKDAKPMLLANQIEFDKQGRIEKSHVMRQDLIRLGEGGKGASTEVSTKEWLKKNTTHVDKWGWYDEVRPNVSDQNELMLYDDRAGKRAVRWDMSNMGVSTNTAGALPSVNVQKLIDNDNAVMAFWDPDKPRDPILVKAHDGKLKLDQTDWGKKVDVYKDGKWTKVPSAEIANIAFAKDLGGFKGASNATGYMHKFNMNVSAGMLVEKNGKTEFRSFATDLSRGEVPGKLTHSPEISRFESIQKPQTVIDIPKSFDAPLIATGVTPRRAVAQGERREQATATLNQEERTPQNEGERQPFVIENNGEPLQAGDRVMNESGEVFETRTNPDNPAMLLIGEGDNQREIDPQNLPDDLDLIGAPPPPDAEQPEAEREGGRRRREAPEDDARPLPQVGDRYVDRDGVVHEIEEGPRTRRERLLRRGRDRVVVRSSEGEEAIWEGDQLDALADIMNEEGWRRISEESTPHRDAVVNLDPNDREGRRILDFAGDPRLGEQDDTMHDPIIARDYDELLYGPNPEDQNSNSDKERRREQVLRAFENGINIYDILSAIDPSRDALPLDNIVVTTVIPDIETAEQRGAFVRAEQVLRHAPLEHGISQADARVLYERFTDYLPAANADIPPRGFDTTIAGDIETYLTQRMAALGITMDAAARERATNVLDNFVAANMDNLGTDTERRHELVDIYLALYHPEGVPSQPGSQPHTPQTSDESASTTTPPFSRRPQFPPPPEYAGREYIYSGLGGDIIYRVTGVNDRGQLLFEGEREGGGRTVRNFTPEELQARLDEGGMRVRDVSTETEQQPVSGRYVRPGSLAEYEILNRDPATGEVRLRRYDGEEEVVSREEFEQFYPLSLPYEEPPQQPSPSRRRAPRSDAAEIVSRAEAALGHDLTDDQRDVLLTEERRNDIADAMAAHVPIEEILAARGQDPRPRTERMRFTTRVMLLQRAMRRTRQIPFQVSHRAASQIEGFVRQAPLTYHLNQEVALNLFNNITSYLREADPFEEPVVNPAIADAVRQQLSTTFTTRENRPDAEYQAEAFNIIAGFIDEHPGMFPQDAAAPGRRQALIDYYIATHPIAA